MGGSAGRSQQTGRKEEDHGQVAEAVGCCCKRRLDEEAIREIELWCNKSVGEVNYEMTQFLSGHCSFNSYLHRMGLRESPNCVPYALIVDIAEHTFF